MKHLINIFTITVACLLTTQVDAQQQKQLSLSLKQAQEYALQHNSTMKNAQLDIEIAKKRIWETKAMGLPQANISGSYQHLFNVPEMSLPSSVISSQRMEPIPGHPETGTWVAVPTGVPGDSIYQNSILGNSIKLGVKDNATFNLNVTQLIFSGEYIVGLQATKVFFQISQNSLQASTSDLKESVANTYYLVQVMERNKEILTQSLASLSKTLSDMKQMNEQGFIESTDVDQIELTVLTLENGLKSISNQVTASYDLLKFQLGLPFESSLTLTDNLDNITNATDIAAIISKQFQVQNQINYKIMENQEDVGMLNLKRQKSAYLPTLAAFYKHTENAKKADFDFTMKDMVGLSLNIPLFSSGMRNVMVQQRSMELQKIRNTKTSVAQGLELDFINSRNSLISAFDQFTNEKRNIELTSRIYDKTLQKYKEGISSSMDLTNAQNQYLTAQRNYYTALYSLLTSKNKLEKLLNIQ